MAKELSILLRAQDMASKTIKGVNKELSGLGKVQGHISRGAKVLGATMVGLGTVAAGGIVMGVKAAGDFEEQLNIINTVAGAQPEELDAIGQGIRALARDTGASLDDLTAAYYDLVSAGVSAKDAQGVLTAANTLAIGGLATTAETADLLTTALNSYGLKASEVTTVADQFAQAIAAGKVTAAELAGSFAQVGPIAAQSGIEIRELAAGYAVLTAKGVPAAEASTQMRAGIMALLKPTKQLEALQAKTGINFARLAKQKGLIAALERMRIEAKKAGVPLTDLLGRVEALNLAAITTGENFEEYNDALADIDKSGGTAARQMAERTKGFNFQMAKLGALVRDIAITIGSKLLPKITPLVEKFAAFVSDNQPGIEKLGDSLASAFESAAQFVMAIPWGTVADALKIAADFAKGLIGAFTSMPPQAQATILALAGLNKLTGGAVSGIVSELGKGLIKGVLGMTAGVVHLKAATVIGGPGAGLPVGPAAGAAAGGAASMGLGAALIGTVGAAVIGGLIAEAVVTAIVPESQRTPEKLEEFREDYRRPRDSSGRPMPKPDDKQPKGGGRGDKSTAAEVRRLGVQQGVVGRIIAAGGKATAARVAAVIEKADRQRQASDDRTASRIASLNAAVNSTTAAIGRIKVNPHVGVVVNVTQTVSIRDQVVANRKRYAYQGGSTGLGGGNYVPG